ncbi:ABC transporter ATP-binding protein [Tengunoibacter tsumagoiensis]|uniref:Helicase n=1 Tax=Tengunoibacter tsumagoiensis TaxID=2014871 RepID=A0A402A9Z7_9CHLR|nr:ABC transporter ATP-binding protein [Tengunoibacter tsumagoiensis]GCE15918.1 helicase [Tengunoibacter tsumagoiensis]
MQIPLQRYLTLLGVYLKPQWYKTVLMVVLLLGNIGLDLYRPQITKTFIDTAGNGDVNNLLHLAILFVVIAIVSQIFSMLSGYLSTVVSWTATNTLRRDLTEHILSLDMSYHKEHTPGEMIERIDGDVGELASFFSEFLVNVFSNGLLLIGVLILFYTISLLVGLSMTIFVIFAFVALTAIRRRSISVWKQKREMSALFFGFLEERLRGTEDIRANGATGYTMRTFFQMRRLYWPINLRSAFAVISLYGGSQILFAIGTALTLGLGGYLWSTKSITLGTAYLLYSYMNRLNWPIQQIQSQFQDLQQAEASMKRVEELFNTQSALQDGPGTPLPAGPLSVDFEGMTFGYLEDEAILHDLTFRIPAGRVLGVLGRTGSGKTTLGRLLFRLYDAQQGTIKLGGVPVKEATLHELRQRVGIVTQDVQIFHASVRDNLTFFNPDIPDEKIIQTLSRIGLSYWYEALEEGLDTTLGSEGSGLSAGEAQLLAFTRVFLHNPGLIILDEASSRLDPATEHLIEQAIDTLFTNRTAIIIAHRLATVQRADDILILENGRILEYGEQAALASQPDSRFSYLLKTGLEGAYA